MTNSKGRMTKETAKLEQQEAAIGVSVRHGRFGIDSPFGFRHSSWRPGEDGRARKDVVSRNGRGFTLIELLVVIAIIGALASFLLPALKGAKDRAKSAMCLSNLRQLATASILYANSNDDYFPPSSWDLTTRNLTRWHGTRANQGRPFEFATSPLQPYLQADRVKACPMFESYLTGFESGCGGYGYNDDYVGSGRGVLALPPKARSWPARRGEINDPTGTIMFADCAFTGPGGSLIEYSFVTEPVFEVYGNSSSLPSIHFRHHGRANVAWCDGHVSSESFGWSPNGSWHGDDYDATALGYIGASQDNRLYDRN